MRANIDKLVARKDQLVQMRGNWDSHYQEIAERIWPNMAEFNVTWAKGEKRTNKMYDGTGALALERFAAIVESVITPRSQTWHKLAPSSPDLMRSKRVRQYFEDLNRLLFSYRYSPRANYASQQNEVYMSLGAFGTGGMFIDKSNSPNRNLILYKSVPLSCLYIGEGVDGRIDEVFRKIPMSLLEIAEVFGTEQFNQTLKNKLEKEPHCMMTVWHSVFPNSEFNPNSLRSVDKAYASVYWIEDENIPLQEGGFDSFPYSVSRYATTASEIMGRSPAMMVLPNIKIANEMYKTAVKTAQRLADPTLLLREDGALTTVNTMPAALVRGGLDEEGREMVKPLQTGANLNVTMEMLEQQRRLINDSFLVNLFQILVDNPQMTATEVMERAQEKGALLSPTMGRQQSEALSPMIEREVDILAAENLLPEMPPELVEAQGEYNIEYTSPLSRQQRAEEVSGIIRTFQTIAPYAQYNPSIYDNVDGDQILRIAAEVHGMPESALFEEKVVERIRQTRQQSEAQEAQIQQAQGVGAALKDVAQAQAIGGGQ
jgi:hypothetical protein